MRTWVLPAVVACILLGLTDYFGLNQQAWWLLPIALFPVALTAMVLRNELTPGAVTMLLMLSGILAVILRLGL